MKFDLLVRHKALSLRYRSSNPELLDHLLSQGDNAEKSGLKKVQFLIAAPMHLALQEVCSYLSVSQREFMESVVAEAIEKAWEIIGQEAADPESLGYNIEEAEKC